MPEVAGGIAVRWADPAAPWLAAVGADPRGTALSASIVARVSLRYDDTTADLLHDEEYEAVLHPLSEPTDATRAIAVDYDDRDLRTEPLQPATYSLSDAPLRQKAYFTGVERGLVDHLTRSLTLEILANRELKLFSRPGEPAEDFARRCLAAGDERADAETAKLRDKYETRATRLRDQLRDAHDRTAVLQSAHDGQRNEELLSTAGSILGGLLGGRSRSGMLGSVLGKAAGKRSRTATANSRLSASKNKEASLTDQLEDLEAELTQELLEIDSRWKTVAANVTTMPITLERSDVKVTQLAVVWLPVS